MEQFDKINQKRNDLYETVDGFKSVLKSLIGVFIAVVGIAIVFFISSLQGTRNIEANNQENAILITMWRKDNTTDFPEAKVDIINYKGHDFFFLVSKYDNENKPIEWTFAYNGGFGYVFQDTKFYILTGFTIFVSLFVAMTNYSTSISGAMETIKFKKTLKVYQEAKQKCVKHTQYLPDFCNYKNKQLYDNIKRSIVESANITYEFYNSEEFSMQHLEKWQKKILKRIENIKIKRLTPSMLLQERVSNAIRQSLLPVSPEEQKRNYLIRSIFSKVVSVTLSGTTVALGVVLGNFFLGATYGFTVFSSFICANLSGADYANAGLRQRYIAKVDLLNEFENIAETFVKKEEENKEGIIVDDTKITPSIRLLKNDI